MNNYERIYRLVESLDTGEKNDVDSKLERDSFQKKLYDRIAEDVEAKKEPQNAASRQAAIREMEKQGCKDVESLFRNLYAHMLTILGISYRQSITVSKEYEDIQHQIYQVEFMFRKLSIKDLARKHCEKTKKNLIKFLKDHQQVFNHGVLDPNPLILQLYQLELRLAIEPQIESEVLSEFFAPLLDTIKAPFGSSNQGNKTSDFRKVQETLKKMTFRQQENLRNHQSGNQPKTYAFDHWLLYRLLNMQALYYQLYRLEETPQGMYDKDLSDNINESLNWLCDFESIHTEIRRGYRVSIAEKIKKLKDTYESKPLAEEKGLQLFLMRRLYEVDLLYGTLSDSPESFHSEAFALAHSTSADLMHLASRSEIQDFLVRFEVNELLLLMFAQEWTAAAELAEALMDKVETEIKNFKKKIDSFHNDVNDNKDKAQHNLNILEYQSEYLNRCYTDLLLIRISIEGERRYSSWPDQTKIIDWDRKIQGHFKKKSPTEFQKKFHKLLKKIEKKQQHQRKERQTLYEEFLSKSFPEVTPLGQALRYWLKYLIKTSPNQSF